MGIITLLVPFGIIPTNFNISTWGITFTNPILYGLFWVYVLSVPGNGFELFDFYFTWLTIPLSILNLLYLWQMVRYYQGKSTRFRAVLLGVLSITLPTILSLTTTGIINPFIIFIFIGPLPIQFLVGLIIMYRVPGPDLPSAFSSEMEDLDRSVPDRAMVIASLYSDSEDDDRKKSANK